MRHNYIVCFMTLFLFIAGNTAAQQNSELKREINSIKKNTEEYLYAESTLPNKSDALESALEELQGKANSWAGKQGAGNIENIAKKIEMPRGNMFRAFVYARKSDISATQGSSAINKPVQAEERVQTHPTVTAPQKTDIPAAIKRMLPMRDYTSMAACIKELKKEGEILKFSRYTADTANIETYALVIYDTDGNIEAILSPGIKRTNYLTGKPDSLDNYTGSNGRRGALIIKLKQ